MCRIAFEKGKQFCNFEPLPVPTTHRGISVNFILSIFAAARIKLCGRASSNPSNGQGCNNVQMEEESCIWRADLLPSSSQYSCQSQEDEAMPTCNPSPTPVYPSTSWYYGLSLFLSFLLTRSHIIDYDVSSFSDEYEVGLAHEFCFFYFLWRYKICNDD